LDFKCGQEKARNIDRGTIGHIAPNRLKRDFTATDPNQKWVTGITEFKAKDGGKVYLSPI